MNLTLTEPFEETDTGVTVDVLTPKALPKSFRDQVLLEAIPV